MNREKYDFLFNILFVVCEIKKRLSAFLLFHAISEFTLDLLKKESF